MPTGAKAEAWCLLIRADASLSCYRCPCRKVAAFGRTPDAASVCRVSGGGTHCEGAACDPGEAVQVDPIKHTLKAAESERLKL